jgi:hypothetical protein
LAGCVLAQPVLAQEDDGSCRNGMFAEENNEFGVARVVGAGRLYFLQDLDGCPNATAACRQRAYVITGDRLVTGRSKGAYVCAYFPNSGGGSAGWVDRSRLRAETVNPRPTLAAWAGTWKDFDNRVTLSSVRGGLEVEGEAFWPSANPSLEERPGGPNTGEIGGRLELDGNRAFEPECRVRFMLLGRYLIVADPTRSCDGFNVAFTGVYLRARR